MVRHAVNCLHAKVNKFSLLPNRSVAVDSLTLKEAVMHQADPKHQDDDKKEAYEDNCHHLKQGCFPLRIGRWIRFICHLSCLVRGSGGVCGTGKFTPHLPTSLNLIR
jgi:hypothetical protein